MLYTWFMPKKLTQKQAEIRINEKQDGQYELLGQYQNKDTPVLIRCKYCDLEWKCVPNVLFRSRVGINCKHHVSLTPEMARYRVETASEQTIEMVGEYLGAKTLTQMKCQICGYEWNTEPYVIYAMNSGCPNCSGNRHSNTAEFKKKVFQLVGNEYTVLGNYENVNTKILIKHNFCGYESWMTPKHFLKGQRCLNPTEIIERRMKNQTMTLYEAQDRLKNDRHGEYEIISGFTKASGMATFRHEKCGRSFTAKVSPVLNNKSGCPYCYASHGEDAVRQYLYDGGFNFEEQYRIPECRNKRALPFDFVVFKNNQIQCLIEYQGIQHYEPKWGRKQLEMTQFRDKIKFDFCQKNGIKLIRIPYKRWYSYSKLLKQVYSYLDYHLTSIASQTSLLGDTEKA